MGLWQEIDESKDFGLAAAAKTIELPSERLAAILVTMAYKVTDAGIVAGETLGGAIDQMTIGEGGNTPVDVRRDEIDLLAEMLSPGDEVGTYLDGLPTTATTYYAHWLLEGPFQLTKMAKPQLRLAMKAITDEWAGASAFEGVLRVAVKESADQNKKGRYLVRDQKPTSTKHEMRMGYGFVRNALLYLADGSYLTRANIGTGAKKTGSKKDLDLKTGWIANKLWSAYKNVADVAGAYYFQNLDSPTYAGRQMVAELGTTSPALLFSENLVEGY